jgi:hypothetical protein
VLRRQSSRGARHQSSSRPHPRHASWLTIHAWPHSCKLHARVTSLTGRPLLSQLLRQLRCCHWRPLLLLLLQLSLAF